MELKDQLIHDICVLQERINCCYDEAPQRLDDAKKLEERQRKAVDTYLDEARPRLTFDDKPAFASKSKVNFAELDEEGHGFSPRRVDPQLLTSSDWCKCISRIGSMRYTTTEHIFRICRSCQKEIEGTRVEKGPKTVEQ